MKYWSWPQWLLFVLLAGATISAIIPLDHAYWQTESVNEHQAWTLVDVFFFAWITHAGKFWNE
jgi:hypothetical protein